MEFSTSKIQIFLEGYKNVKTSPNSISSYLLSSKKVEWFFFQIFVAFLEYLNCIGGTEQLFKSYNTISHRMQKCVDLIQVFFSWLPCWLSYVYKYQIRLIQCTSYAIDAPSHYWFDAKIDIFTLVVVIQKHSTWAQTIRAHSRFEF